MSLIQINCRCKEFEEGTTCGMCRPATISGKYIGVTRTDSSGSFYWFSPWGGMVITDENNRMVGEIFKGNMYKGEFVVCKYEKSEIHTVDDWFRGMEMK